MGSHGKRAIWPQAALDMGLCSEGAEGEDNSWAIDGRGYQGKWNGWDRRLSLRSSVRHHSGEFLQTLLWVMIEGGSYHNGSCLAAVLGLRLRSHQLQYATLATTPLFESFVSGSP